MSFFGGFPFGDEFFGGRHQAQPKKDVNTTRFYEILGVPKTATQDEIKKAYRKQAKVKHPDKGGSQKEFQELQSAFDVLSDEKKRKIYDVYGEEGLREGMDSEPSEGIDIMDILNGRGGGRGKQRTKSVLQQLDVTLEDIYKGTEKYLQISRQRLCPTCKGSGSNNPNADTKCQSCGGKGIRIISQRSPFGIIQTQSECRDCRGEGYVVRDKDKCSTCKGERIVKQDKLLKISLDKGAPDKKRYKFDGESDEYPGYEPGDVIIEINIKKHKQFIRNGADLTYNAEISLLEALTGFQLEIKHLDGRTIYVSSKPGQIIKPGELKTVHDCGMPFYDSNARFGNLYINFKIVFPKKLDESQKKALKDLFPSHDMEIENDSSIKEKYSMTEYIESETNQSAKGGNGDRKGSMDQDDDDSRRGGTNVNCQQQ